MISPWPPVGPALFPEGLVLALMIVGNVYVVARLFPRGSHPLTLADITFLLGLLLMAMGLWFALIYAAIDPSGASEISVFIALNSMMAVVGCWLLALFLRAETMRPAKGGWTWPLIFTALFVGNEFLMGVAFVLFQTGPGYFQAAGWTGLATLSGAAATSAWFYVAMLANMLALVLWLPLDPASRSVLLGFSLTAALGPLVASDPPLGIAATGVLMVGVLLVMARARRLGPLTVEYGRTLLVVWGAFALMGLGEGGVLTGASSPWGLVALGLSGMAAMTLELVVLTRRGLRGEPTSPSATVPPDRPPTGAASASPSAP